MNWATVDDAHHVVEDGVLRQLPDGIATLGITKE